MPKTILIIGHAGKPHPGAVTLDIDPQHHPDVVHDLNVVPLPFKDNEFQKIIAHHVLEHLGDLGPVMGELHRVCRADGEIDIEVPHHSSWCANTPWHKLRFNSFAFDSFVAGVYTWNTGRKFKLIKKEVTFHRAFRRFFLHKIFNAKPMVYERFWTYIFPAEHLKVTLQPLKSSA
jgi:SAM-dependent methyltransferase